MRFSSLPFLFGFLPITLAVYFAVPARWRNLVLLLTSLIFYGWGEPVYILLMILSVLVNWLAGRWIGSARKGARLPMVLAVVFNLALLGVFKYSGFLMETLGAVTGLALPVPRISLPIGISFFTFQAMSYVLDVYWNPGQMQKSFWKLLLYISFFPQLIAGPIVRYHDIEGQLSSRTVTVDETAAGLRRFLAGLAKKMLLANAMAVAADGIFGMDLSILSAPAAWIGAIAYLFQIYFDFSGYSDMAIGLGWMFGFHFKENFNYPYSSTSIREFWRRWHISLSSWFLEYLYIPLGGNRKGKVRTCINKFIVFLCTGIWHGANVTFLFWGIYHGCFLMLEEFVPFFRKEGGKIKTAVMRIYTLLVVCIGFVFFRADTMTQGMQWVKAMFTGFSMGTASTSLALQQLTPLYLVTFTVACIASFPVFEKWKSDGRYQAFYNNMAFVCSIIGLVLCMLSLAGGTYNPFIYFRF